MTLRKPCAACGARKCERRTTFLVDRVGCHGEFHICPACWADGYNNEAWNERITQAIIQRRAAQQASA